MTRDVGDGPWAEVERLRALLAAEQATTQRLYRENAYARREAATLALRVVELRKRLEPECGAFGCHRPAAVAALREHEWQPGRYCAEHGEAQ